MEVKSLAQAYWNQRHALAARRERLTALSAAVNHPGDLTLFQWAQLMALTLEFQPDLVLELGRGKGNSTCVFTEAANLLGRGACRVLSLCLSDDWQRQTAARVAEVVPQEWFEPLRALRTDILAYPFKEALRDARRVMVFWDAHGFEVAECVLGGILPEIASRPHVVAMHDMCDARYIDPARDLYGDLPLWKGNNWEGPHLRIGNIHSTVEQAVAITDFTVRNRLPLHSVDHELHTEMGTDPAKLSELRSVLSEPFYSLSAHWHWFSLNETSGPWTFPKFVPPVRLSQEAKKAAEAPASARIDSGLPARAPAGNGSDATPPSPLSLKKRIRFAYRILRTGIPPRKYWRGGE